MLCDAALWRHQIESLSDVADCTVADLTQDNSMAAMAARTLEAAPERFALAGLSMGGYVAQEIMRQAPQRVERLALLDTAATIDDPIQFERRKALIRQLSVGKFRGVTRRLLPLLIHPDHLDDEELISVIKKSAEDMGPEAYVRQQSAILTRPDGRGDLGAIRCPTLILCGRQDELIPLALHREMVEAIPGATLVVIEDSGHLPPLEQPEAVSAAMRDWLTGN
jgi:pimeloyl-ACP methyl ester carboxylesterase